MKNIEFLDAKKITKNTSKGDSKMLRILVHKTQAPLPIKIIVLSQKSLPGRKHLMMRELAYSFELRYKTKLEKLINNMEFSLNTIQDEYQEILDLLLGKKITWKRIVLMFSITGFLASESIERNKPSNVIMFMDTLLSLYISRKLIYWVLANGNWEHGLEKCLRQYLKSNQQNSCCIII